MNIVSKFSGFAILTPFLAFLMYANDWRQQPPESWSWQTVLQILNESPWVCKSSTAFPATAVISQDSEFGKTRRPSLAGSGAKSSRIVPFFPAVRLISAKPIRNAYLRQRYFQELFGLGLAGRAIDVKTLTQEAAARAQLAQDEFAKSNPMLMGDSEHIVVSVLFTAVHLDLSDGVSASDPAFINPLEDMAQSDLFPVTFLSTKTGKRMTFIRYSAPGRDGLGAKFLFARATEDGTPSVVQGDKELRFETRIKGRKIEAKFDLSKLVYQGELEL